MEKMAAPSDAELRQKPQQHVDGGDTVREHGSFSSEPVGALREHVVRFLTNKTGGDLKMYKNIGDVLEGLKEENDVLSEQVNLLIRNRKSLTRGTKPPAYVVVGGGGGVFVVLPNICSGVCFLCNRLQHVAGLHQVYNTIKGSYGDDVWSACVHQRFSLCAARRC